MSASSGSESTGPEPLARLAASALSWRAAGLVVSKIVYLTRSLVLARLLAPDQFGLFAAALIPLDLLLNVTELGLTQALVQRREARGREYDAAWTLGLARALGVAAVVVVAAPSLAGLFAEPRAAVVLQVLALRPLLGACASIRVAELERRLNFRALALIQIPAALAAALVSILLAAALGVWALVAGSLAGAAVGVAMSYVLAPHRPRLVFDRVATQPLLRFGRWVLLSGLVGVLGEAALRAVISRRLGTSELGVYFLAATLAILPNDVLGSLVSAVAFPLHARVRADDRRATEAFRISLVALAAVLVPAYAVLIALAPALVRHVLGAQWSGTAPILRLLALAAVLGTLFDATAPLLEGRGKPHKVTALFAALSATVVALGWVLVGRIGLIGAALTWAAGELAVFLLCVVFARQALTRPFAGLTGPLAAVGAAGLGAAAAAGAGLWVVPGAAGVLTGATLGAVTAVALLWGLDRHFDLGLSRDFNRVFPDLRQRLRLGPRRA